MTESDDMEDEITQGRDAGELRREAEERARGEEAMMLADGASRGWATSRGRYWTLTRSEERLPAGVYGVGMSQRLGPYLDRMRVVKDDLVVLPDMGAEQVMAEIAAFMAALPRYRRRGYVHKRGILMEGPPGSGKTSNVELLIDMFVSGMGGVVLSTQDVGQVIAGLGLVREREPDRPVMVVIEDIDGVIKGGAEQHILNLLDGRHQHDRVVVVATTNHLDRLPERIANRPSRFDLVFRVGMPTADAKRAYVRSREPDLAAEVVGRMVEETSGYTIAHLKELLILHCVYEMPLDAALARMRGVMERKLLPAQASLTTVAAETSFGIQGDERAYRPRNDETGEVFADPARAA